VVFYFKCNDDVGLKKCASLVDKGSIVVFPTDTVYGIGCDPFNDESVLRLYRIKNRPLDKYMPILTNGVDGASALVEITKEAATLIKQFWPGQLTLILKTKKNSLIPKYTFGKTVAIRIPNNQCTIKLINMTRNKLLVGTSANLSSHHPFVDIQELEASNLHGYDALVDDGVLNNSLNAVSTIADLVEVGNPKIIREGLIPRERIFTVLKGL